jgi:hypothetical protein
MKSLVLFLCLSAASAFAGPTGDQDKKVEVKGDGVEGVKGTLYVIDGNKNMDTKLTVQAHDVILIEWTYPISPPFPKSATQKSSDEAVAKASGVRRVVNVKGPIGVGRFGAVFITEKTGTATLTFTINTGEKEVRVTCEVNVK